MRVVLASASPRRRELLAQIGVGVEVRPADVDETPHPDEDPADLVSRLATMKADAALAASDEVVIAADTVVCVDGQTLGKPVDDADAVAVLRKLSGRSHEVTTGVAVQTGDRSATAVERTEVRFRAISDAEIIEYVATGEPMDKAGAYAIQGYANVFVTGMVGSDTNVIGLPLATTAALLGQVGLTIRLLSDRA